MHFPPCTPKFQPQRFKYFRQHNVTFTINFAGGVHWDEVRIILGCIALGALLLKTDILWVVVVGTVISILVLR